MVEGGRWRERNERKKKGCVFYLLSAVPGLVPEFEKKGKEFRKYKYINKNKIKRECA